MNAKRFLLSVFCQAVLATTLLSHGIAQSASDSDTTATLALGAPPLLAPALGLHSPPNGGAGTNFESPVFGPEVTCDGSRRQIVVLNPKIGVGEPLYIRMLFRREPGVATPRFQGQLAYGTDFRIRITPPRPGRPYEYKGANLGSTVPTSVIEMEQIPVARLDFRLAMDTQTVSGAAFDQYGVYTLDVTLNCVGDETQSGAQSLGQFRINVGPVEGEDLEVAKLLSRDFKIFEPIQERAAMSVRGQRFLTVEQEKLYRKVIAEYPNALLRPHMMIVIADLEDKMKNEKKAIELYQQIQREYPNHPVYQEAFSRELAIHTGLNNSEKVRQGILRMWTDSSMAMVVHPRVTAYGQYIAPYRQKIGTQWMLWDVPGPDPIGAGLDEGIRIRLSGEVQEQLGLPEFVTPEQLSSTPMRMNAAPTEQRQGSAFGIE